MDITPDKSLIKKLGLTGYRTEQAMAELVDNSIDARIKGRMECIEVRLDFEKRQVVVEDDGQGMGLDELKDALTIARETKQDGEKLGRFGLGMKSACSALGKSFVITTTRPGLPLRFTARYDEDRWLGDESMDWTNFEIEEDEEEEDKHGTVITVDKLKIPLYPNQLSNFRRRFGIRYGPYLRDKQIRLRVGRLKDCEAVDSELEEGTRQDFVIKLPDNNQIIGWIGLLKKRSIKGDYGIHLYRKGRLIKAFDKFGIRSHPEVSKIIGEASLDHVPVNFHKTGFLQDSLEYKEAVIRFKNDPTVVRVMRDSSLRRTDISEIKSIFEYEPGETPKKQIDTRLSSANAKSLLRRADNIAVRAGSIDLSVEFEDYAEKDDICQISCSKDKARVTINRSSDVFGIFKNPLFLFGFIRLEAELAAENPSVYSAFINERNRRWGELVGKFLPRPEVKKSRSEEKIVPTPRYSLEGELIELHDHLKEAFGHDFQFTGLSTLTPFLHNAYSKIIYSMHTVNGAGQELLDAILGYTERFTVLLDPTPSEIGTILGISKGGRLIVIREYAKKFPTTWATPEKAWLDLYAEVKKSRITLYGDELAMILAELLDSNLADPKKMRALARHVKLLDEVETYLEGG